MSENTNRLNEFDRKMMRNCFSLAKKGLGFVSPNPLVGATIVKNEKIIAQGWHRNFGETHAEINAIHSASESVKDSTIYINLEPCSYHGKTPACSLELIRQGFRRVVIATLDPNPLVSGNGVKMLQNAGIIVDSGVLEKEALKLNERFFKYIQTNKPFIALKMAISLDGKIATATGKSKWITNEKSRRFAHRLRLKYAAVLVGINTVLADNPTLNVRLKNVKTKNPLRIVVDSQLRSPLEAKIFDTSVAPTWIATTPKADSAKIKLFENKGIRILICPEKESGIDLHFLTDSLAKEGIDSLLVEGGGTLNFSFLMEKLADKVYAFIAPKLIGGEKAKTAVEGKGFARLEDAAQLKKLSYKKFKNDLLIEAYT